MTSTRKLRTPGVEVPRRTLDGSTRDVPIVRLVKENAQFELSPDLAELLESEGHRLVNFNSVEELLHARMDDSHPGCIVLGIRTLGPCGIEAQNLLASNSELPVILVTANATAREVVWAMKHGAADLFCNPLDEGAFVSAIKKAVVEHRSKVDSRERRVTLQLRRSSLSPREMQVFDLIVNGDSSKRICERLGFADRTLKHHRSRVMEKMGVKTVAQLVRAAVGSGQQAPIDVDGSAARVAPKGIVEGLPLSASK